MIWPAPAQVFFTFAAAPEYARCLNKYYSLTCCVLFVRIRIREYGRCVFGLFDSFAFCPARIRIRSECTILHLSRSSGLGGHVRNRFCSLSSLPPAPAAGSTSTSLVRRDFVRFPCAMLWIIRAVPRWIAVDTLFTYAA